MAMVVHRGQREGGGREGGDSNNNDQKEDLDPATEGSSAGI